jgi:hypothetical protein
VVFGATPFAALGALSGKTIPLFAQRMGELARMPGALPDGRVAPLLAATARGIYVVSGTLTGLSGDPPIAAYDLLLLSPLGAWAAPVHTPVQHTGSFALVQLSQADADGDIAVGVLIDASGQTQVGLSTQTLECSDDPSVSSTSCSKAASISWSDLVGGPTVTDGNGNAYVVGPGRSASPGGTLLLLSTAGTEQSTVISARQGAAVAWATGTGVFIYGGSATAAGAEIVNASLGAPETLAYPPDPAMNIAAAQFDQGHMLIAGSVLSNMSTVQPCQVDLTCSAGCSLAPWGLPLPYALSSPSLFAMGHATFVIVGDDPAGSTHVFELTASSTQEIVLKIPRQGARAVQTQTGAVVVAGGGSPLLESFVP